MSNKEISVEGIVLRQTDYKDNDVIISFISNDGYFLNLYARGIRKTSSKNAGSLQPMTRCQITYFENTKGLQLLKSASYLSSYVNDVKDYDVMMAAFVIVEIIINIQKMEVKQNKAAYAILDNSLASLTKQPLRLLLAKVIAHILENSGQGLIASKCAVCNSSKVNYISYDHGGFVCYECLENNDVEIFDIQVLKLFRFVNTQAIASEETYEFKENDLTKLLEIMYYFYNQFTGERIRNIEHFINVDL